MQRAKKAVFLEGRKLLRSMSLVNPVKTSFVALEDEDGTAETLAYRPAEEDFAFGSGDKVVVVGLCGAAGAGKNTAADFLTLRYGFKQFSFAEPIKRAAAHAFCVPYEHMNDRVLKEKKVSRFHLTPREMVQWLGTDVFRQKNEDFWLVHMARRIDDYVKECKSRDKWAKIVLTDCRFANEAEMVLEASRYSRVWEVVAPLRLDGGTTLKNKSKSHECEKGVPERLVSNILPNDGTIAELYRHMETLVSDFPKEIAATD